MFQLSRFERETPVLVNDLPSSRFRRKAPVLAGDSIKENKFLH